MATIGLDPLKPANAIATASLGTAYASVGVAR